MSKVIKVEKITRGRVKTFNRYFNDYKLAKTFAKEQGTKTIRVDDKAKGKYLVQYMKYI